MRTILLSAAARHKGCTAADTGSLIRTDHVFFPKQLRPNDPVQFRIDGQYTFQKVIAVDGSIVNRRIPGIDDSTVTMVNTFSVDVIAAFLVRQGSDLTDHLSLHIFYFESRLFSLLCFRRVSEHVAGNRKPSCVRIMLRDSMTQGGCFIRTRRIAFPAWKFRVRFTQKNGRKE